MKALIAVFAAASVATVSAADIYVGAAERKVIDTETSVVQSNTVVVSDRGTLVKEGAGELTLKTGVLAQEWKAAFEVKEGTLKLDGASVTGHTFSGVPAILSKAALHLDASDMDSLICNGDRVMEWLDTRETGSETDGYQ